MRLIDADALKKVFHAEWDDVLIWDESGKTTADEFCNLVDAAPTIEAEPVRKGSYKVIYDPFMMRHKFECMECGHTFYIGNAGLEFDYCPKCGIKITRAETINAWTGEPETEDE